MHQNHRILTLFSSNALRNIVNHFKWFATKCVASFFRKIATLCCRDVSRLHFSPKQILGILGYLQQTFDDVSNYIPAISVQ